MASLRRFPTRFLPLICCAALVALLSGCWGGNQDESDDADDVTTHAPPSADPIRLLVIDDATLSDAIQREWQGYADKPLDIRQQTAEEFEAAQLSEPKPIDADAVVYPAGLIGLLAERELIEPLPDAVIAGRQYDQADLLAHTRLNETKWGDQVYAVSFGSPQFVLMYRADLFQKLGVDPPATWEQYQSIAEKLADRKVLSVTSPDGDEAENEENNTQESDWYGTVEPLGPGWASQMLLARSAAYARRGNRYSTLFDYDTMQPLVDRPPFVRALEELVAAAKLGPPDARSFTPHDARRTLLTGHAAMAVCWPTWAAIPGQDPLAEPVRFPVRFAEAPGSPQVFADDLGWVGRTDEEDSRVPLLSVSGRLGSVVKDSPRARSAASVLAWLSRKRAGTTDNAGAGAMSGTARIAGPRSAETTIYRTSQLRQPTDWVDDVLRQAPAASYSEVVTQTHIRSTPLFSIRIPGRSRYLSALDEAVYAAIDGEQTAQEALAAAAAKWDAITDELGREQQNDAYLRSLGLEP